MTGNKNRPIPLAEVEHLTGFKHSKIYNDVAAGKFPKPVRLGSKSVRWVEAEIMAWVAEQIAKRDAARDMTHTRQRPGEGDHRAVEGSSAFASTPSITSPGAEAQVP